MAVRSIDQQPRADRGLTAAEAAQRLDADGPNVLPVRRGRPAWQRLGAEMVHFFALLFWAAAALAFIAGLPQLGIAVLVVVVLNGVFAFVQEQRAEHAAEQLRHLLPSRVTVLRDGIRCEISAVELVVDDVVLLSEGDRVSGDLRLDTVYSLAIDTSTLTGESVPEHPRAGDVVAAGCFVVEGEGRATVVATGAHTRLAGIADLTQSQQPAPTPLRLELDRVSRIIAAVAIAVGGFFFGVALLVGTPASDGFLFAVGVTVAVVPCGLLPTVTLSLAIGAQRMAARHALVRHLEAVETLGSATFICTDKTGTLTRNEMFGVLGPAEAAISLAAFVATFAAAGWRPGDTFPEGATLLAASGAAFTAVVIGQIVNAFACRSTIRPLWTIGWTNNRLLLGAIVAEIGMLAAFLYLPPLADLLDQAGPSWAGFAVALIAIPAVLVADTLQKRNVRDHQHRQQSSDVGR